MKMDFILSNTNDYAFQLALLDCLEKAQNNVFEDYIVVMPEDKTLYAERFLLENHKAGSFTNIYVYSFNRLLRKVQVTKALPISQEAGIMIVRNLIMQLQDDLVCYKKTAGTVGFAENVYNTISQLKTSGVSPLELAEISQKVKTSLQIKLKDISLIYDAYERYLGEELVDSNDKLTMLENLSQTSDFITNAHVYAVGFESLTTSASSVIKAFVKNAKSVTVSATFMHPEKSNSHIADNDVYNRFKTIAESLHIRYNPVFKEQPLIDDFKHINKFLFSYPTSKVVRKGNINLFGASSFYVESRKVASLIKKSVIDNKSRYKDNCIYVSNNEQIEFIISALKEFEIPYFVALDYQFENHAFFAFIKGLFSVVKKNFEMQDVINLSKNILLDFSKDKLDDFDNYVVKYAINHNKFLKPFAYGDKTTKSYKNAEQIREQFVKIILKFAGIYQQNMTVKEICSSINQFLHEFDVENRMIELERTQKKQGEVPSQFATKQVLTKAREVLEMLSLFIGEQKIDLEDFYTLLISGLQSADITLLPLGIDQVQVVASPEGLYGIKNLYIVGASEGMFPVRKQDLGLIQDGEIGVMEGLNKNKIEPTIKSINRRERYKIFELLVLPTEKLYISFSEHLNSGEEVKMSSIMQMISDLFLNEDKSQYKVEYIYSPFDDFVITSQEQEDLIKSLGNKNVMQNYLSKALGDYKKGEDYRAGHQFIASLYKALNPTFDKLTRQQFEQVNLSKQYEKLNNANKLYFKKRTTSISQLESYFSCPFKHFANYGLRLKEKEESNMKALDVGDILHLVAERFVKEANHKTDINVEKFAVNCLRNVLSQEKYSQEDNKILINILQGEVVRICSALYQELQVSCFKPTDAEVWFGDQGKYSSIQLCKNPKINLVGKIDRIDKTQDYYRIIDYKTGKIESSAEDIYYGTKLQLPVYLSALRNDKRKPAGVLYFPIRNEFIDGKKKAGENYKMRGFILNDKDVIMKMDNTLSFDNPKSKFIFPELKTAKTLIKNGTYEFKDNSNLLSEKELENMASYVRALSTKAVKEILEGNIEPSPFVKGTRKPCDYCAYRKVCGILSCDYQTKRQATLSNVKNFYQGGNSWEA